MKVSLPLDTISEIDVSTKLDDGEPYANVAARRCTGVELGLAIYTHFGSTKGIERARELAAALNAVADAVEAEMERRERENGAVPIESLAPDPVEEWRPMKSAPRDGSEIIVKRHNRDGTEFTAAWSTNYSIHGLGGHWYPVGSLGQYGDQHLDGWKPVPDPVDPVAESLDREQVEVVR